MLHKSLIGLIGVRLNKLPAGFYQYSFYEMRSGRVFLENQNLFRRQKNQESAMEVTGDLQWEISFENSM